MHIAIAGNIGSGKTTLTTLLAKHYKWQPHFEDADDNPYLVFESLNAKGRPLTQADLIRNYFFMRIHVDEQVLGFLRPNFSALTQAEVLDERDKLKK